MNICETELPKFDSYEEEFEYLKKAVWHGALFFFKCQTRVRYNPYNRFHRELVMAFICDHYGLLARDYKSGGRLSSFMPWIPLSKQVDVPDWRRPRSWETERGAAREYYFDVLDALIKKLHVPEKTFAVLCFEKWEEPVKGNQASMQSHILDVLEPDCLHKHEVWSIEPGGRSVLTTT